MLHQTYHSLRGSSSASEALCFLIWTGGIYADSNGTFGDNQFRFALLSLAACEAPLVLNIGGYRCVFRSVIKDSMSRPALQCNVFQTRFRSNKQSSSVLVSRSGLVCIGRSGTPPGFPYGDRCVFLANDWHASLVRSSIIGSPRSVPDCCAPHMVAMERVCLSVYEHHLPAGRMPGVAAGLAVVTPGGFVDVMR